VGAVVLAAGQGQRLRPVTSTKPKPLVPILNVPLLQWSVRALVRAGITDVVINVFHHTDQMAKAAAEIEAGSQARIRVVEEPKLSGPAGGLIACRPWLPENAAHCLVLHGDVFSDVALADVLATHHESGADLTIVTTPVDDPHRFGVLEVDGSRVVGFREKPTDAPAGSLISCGIYALSIELVRSLDSGGRADFDFHHVVAGLLQCNQKVVTHTTTGYWSDVGDLHTLRQSNLAGLGLDPVLSSVAVAADRPGIWVQGGADIDPSATIEGRVLVGTGGRIGTDATVESSVIGPGCDVGAGAVVRNSVLLAGSSVAKRGVVIDEVLT
jgi:mannose-1-phosphate guanylyltransferase